MIKRLHIKNLKSLLDTDVELSPLTVLIGRSGTGKTNFVQGLRMLQALLSVSHPQPVGDLIHRLGGWDNLGPVGKEKFTVVWELTFVVDGVDGDYQYHLEIPGQRQERLGTNLVKSESLTLGGKILFEQLDGKWLSEPAVKTHRPQGPALGWLTAVREINIAYLTLTRGIGCYDFPSQVLATNAGQGPELGFGLKSDGANYFAVIDAILGNLQSLNTWREIEAGLKKLSAFVAGITTTPFQDERVSVSYQFGGQLLPLPLSQQSGGFRRFLAHLLAIYQQPPKQVVVFEEPENGIFPGALTMLADFMRATNKKLGTQFILTTHSPQLLDAFDGESIRQTTISDQGTKISPLAADDLAALRENLISPSEFLTVTDPMPAQVAGA